MAEDGQARISEAIDAARAQRVEQQELPVAKRGMAVADAIKLWVSPSADGEPPDLLILHQQGRMFVPVRLAPGAWELRPLGRKHLVGVDGEPL